MYIPMKKTQNSAGFIQIILVLAVIVLVGGGMYYFETLKNKSEVVIETPTNEPVAQETQKPGLPTVKPTTDPTAGWKTYTNVTNNFSIKYPSNWSSGSQGPVKDAWQQISSPDLAPKGSQQPQIGMNVSIRVYKQDHIIYQSDLEKFEATKGLPSQNVGAYQIFKNIGSIGVTPLITYEYESNDQSYPYHYWVMDIAENNNTNIISIVVTDFKEDKSLNTKELADQILSTFKFTK